MKSLIALLACTIMACSPAPAENAALTDQQVRLEPEDIDVEGTRNANIQACAEGKEWACEHIARTQEPEGDVEGGSAVQLIDGCQSEEKMKLWAREQGYTLVSSQQTPALGHRIDEYEYTGKIYERGQPGVIEVYVSDIESCICSPGADCGETH